MTTDGGGRVVPILGATAAPPMLIDPTAAGELALWVAGYLAGALIRAGVGVVAIEPHHTGDGGALPSFEATIGDTRLVVHIDQVIA
jgi:hypothetical protein